MENGGNKNKSQKHFAGITLPEDDGIREN